MSAYLHIAAAFPYRFGMFPPAADTINAGTFFCVVKPATGVCPYVLCYFALKTFVVYPGIRNIGTDYNVDSLT